MNSNAEEGPDIQSSIRNFEKAIRGNSNCREAEPQNRNDTALPEQCTLREAKKEEIG